MLGRYLRRCWRRGQLIQLVIVFTVSTAIAVPIYANANAAVGGLFIALAGLAALDQWEPAKARHRIRERLHDSEGELTVLQMAIVLAGITGMGIWLVLGSQAAFILSVLVALVIGWALWKPIVPPQRISLVLGFLFSAMAGLVVIWLGSLESSPSWLPEGLSGARHTLWSDALGLWATNPVFGAGPGAFTPSSELASNTPHLAAVHSLILQVGAELGAVGVVLLVGVFLGGLLFAARGSRSVALIAITAWTALAIHSSIDHLEDFPIVALMVGVVLAWSGFNRCSPEGAEHERSSLPQGTS